MNVEHQRQLSSCSTTTKREGAEEREGRGDVLDEPSLLQLFNEDLPTPIKHLVRFTEPELLDEGGGAVHFCCDADRCIYISQRR